MATLLATLLLRVPAAKGLSWLAYGLTPVAFFLSGVVTMLFSLRCLEPAPAATVALRTVVVLASACLLLGWLAPLVLVSLFLGYEIGTLLSFQAWVQYCVAWLCWVAGGLAISLPRRGRRERTEHSA